MSTYEERLAKNWKWCQAYFKRKTEQFKIVGWTMALDHAKKRLGQTDYNKKRITLSKHFLRGPSCTQIKMRNTILHELAHVLVGSSNGHNKKWKDMALKIGCDGKVCSSMDLPDAKWMMVCPGKCFQQGYFRKPKIENKICAKCKGKPILKQLR
jgi:predicted SprT family Zn-dependent metalloprotease